MTSEFDKIKGSKHYEENLLNSVPGHQASLENAATVIENPVGRAQQADGRLRFWGFIDDNLFRAVVSAATSAGFSIGRLVTIHRDRPNKIGKPD